MIDWILGLLPDNVLGLTIGSILSRLAFILLGVALTFILQYALHARNRRRRRFWSSPGDIIIFTSSQKEPGADRVLIRSGDFLSVAEIYGFLRSIISDRKIQISEMDSTGNFAQYADTNLILIGGPNNNALSRIVLDRLTAEGKHRFSVDDYTFFVGPDVFRLQHNNRKEITRDYGIVLRVPNPYNASRYVIMCAGLKSFGTLAAARMLVSDRFYDNRRLLSLPNNLFSLVAADVAHGHLIGYREEELEFAKETVTEVAHA